MGLLKTVLPNIPVKKTTFNTGGSIFFSSFYLNCLTRSWQLNSYNKYSNTLFRLNATNHTYRLIQSKLSIKSLFEKKNTNAVALSTFLKSAEYEKKMKSPEKAKIFKQGTNNDGGGSPIYPASSSQVTKHNRTSNEKQLASFHHFNCYSETVVHNRQETYNKWLIMLFGLSALLLFNDFSRGYAEEDTEELTLESLKEMLKCHYKKAARIKRLFSDQTVPIQKDYIHLAIVDEPGQNQKEKELAGHESQMGFLDSYEDIYSVKKIIEMEEIFKQSSDQHILVLGRAAVGKSTFFKYLLNLWADGKLWQGKFELVFWLSYRDLEKYKHDKNIDLYEILNQECFAGKLDEIGKETLKRLIEILEPQGKVLYMLDGKDELPTFKYEGTKLGNILNRIAISPYWMNSSRPYEYDYEQMQPDIKLEVLGFSNDNIENYVQMFFAQTGKKPEDSTSLLQLLRRNRSWWGSAHIPLNLELICSYWELELNKDKFNEHIISSSALYQNIINTLLKRYIKNKNISETVKIDYNNLSDKELYNRTEHIIYFLSRLAFEALNEKSFLLSPTLVNKILNQMQLSHPDAVRAGSTFLSEVLDAGFLNTPDSGEDNTKKRYYFNHATFLEWFAAKDIAKQLSDCDDKLGNEHNVRLLNLIAAHKYDPRYEITWSFVSGILNLREDYLSLQRFFDYLYLKPRDILGFYEIRLLTKCLDEALYGKPYAGIPKPTLKQTKDILEHIMRCIEIVPLKHAEPQKSLEFAYVIFGHDERFGFLRSCGNVKSVLLPSILGIINDDDSQLKNFVGEYIYFLYDFDIEDHGCKILNFMNDDSLSEHDKIKKFSTLIESVNLMYDKDTPNYLRKIVFQMLLLLNRNPEQLKENIVKFLKNKFEKLISIDNAIFCTTLKDQLFQILNGKDEEAQCNAINMLTLVSKNATLEVKKEIYDNITKYKNIQNQKIKNEINFSLYILSKELLLNEESNYYASEIKNISTSDETQDDAMTVKKIKFIDSNFYPQAVELVKYIEKLIPISLNGTKPIEARDAALMIGDMFGRLDDDFRKKLTTRLVEDLGKLSKDMQITEHTFTTNFSKGFQKAPISIKLALIQDLLIHTNANNFINAPLLESLLNDKALADQKPDECDRIVTYLIDKHITTNSKLYLPRDFSHLISQNMANHVALQLIGGKPELNFIEIDKTISLLPIIAKKIDLITAEKVAEYLLSKELITNKSLSKYSVRAIGNLLAKLAKNPKINQRLSNRIAHNIVNLPSLLNSYISDFETLHPFDILPFHVIFHEIERTNKLYEHVPILVRRYLTKIFSSFDVYAIFEDKNNLIFYENGRMYKQSVLDNKVRELFSYSLRNTYLYVKEFKVFKKIYYPSESPPMRTPLHHFLSDLKHSNIDQTERENLVDNLNDLLANASVVNDNNNIEHITPLMLAVETGEPYCIDRLLSAGANTTLRNNNGESALDIAFAQLIKDPHNKNKQEILKVLLPRRTPCSYLDFERNFNQLEHAYSGQPIDQENDHKLINQFVDRLIGKIYRVKGSGALLPMEALIASEQRERYITHINSIRDGSFKGISLNGFDGLEFLAMRIRVYTEILLKLTSGDLKLAKLHIAKEQAISAIKREILIMHETLMVAKNVRRIKKEIPDDPYFSFSAKRPMQMLSEALYDAEVTNIMTQINQLRDKEEYVIQSGWSENHCVYVVYRREGPEIIVRVDNRGINSRPDNKSETVACEPLFEIARLSG
jgi:hypothetical protein